MVRKEKLAAEAWRDFADDAVEGEGETSSTQEYDPDSEADAPPPASPTNMTPKKTQKNMKFVAPRPEGKVAKRAQRRRNRHKRTSETQRLLFDTL